MSKVILTATICGCYSTCDSNVFSFFETFNGNVLSSTTIYIILKPFESLLSDSVVLQTRPHESVTFIIFIISECVCKCIYCSNDSNTNIKMKPNAYTY